MEKESRVEAARTVPDRWNAFSVLWKRGEGKGGDGEMDHPNGWSNDDPSPCSLGTYSIAIDQSS